MSTYRLDKLFHPRSLAIVGASTKERSLGRAILRNLRAGGFKGRIDVINPHYPLIDNIPTVSSLGAVPALPDLLVITAPAAAVPQIVQEAAESGVPAAIIISAGLGHGAMSFADKALSAARRHGLRLMGPNGLGLLVPPSGLNASFAARPAKPGDLALISQSGAIAAALVEWSARRSVGFSAIASIGDAIDVDFGDLLDYFARDARTRAILLYVEAITNVSKFLSAARAAARVKPVIVIKTGRHQQGSLAAATHTGALAGSDAVYDAAFRRAGLLRVADLDELFAAAEGLGRLKPFPGRRLAILTNGGGLGVLATDRLMDLDGSLAELSPQTMTRLDQTLPASWSRGNPVDIVGDADAERYANALEALLADDGTDAILALNVPTALASSEAAALQVAETIGSDGETKSARKPVFASWIADDPASSAIFDAHNIPHFASEAKAIQGFMHFVRYRDAQEALIATPPKVPGDFEPRTGIAREVISKVLAQGRSWLDPLEAIALLTAYGIRIAEARLVSNPDEAGRLAVPILQEHGAVAVKIFSRDVIHKSDIGGVRLNLRTPEEVDAAAMDIITKARSVKPGLSIDGITVHPMTKRPQARELIAGIADDQTFGPVIAFGAGGISVEVVNDKALALPPLDLVMARDLMKRTRIFRLLGKYRDVPGADVDAVAVILARLSQLSADLPEIRDIDLNPLLADAEGAIVLDARIRVAPFRPTEFRAAPDTRLAIRPYPRRWEKSELMRDGRPIFIRPIRPEDEPALLSFLKRMDPEDIRLRFFTPMRRFSHHFIAGLTQLDYGRNIAFLALDQKAQDILGVVRLHADPDHKKAEFAIIVRSDLKGLGLGTSLMRLAIRYGQAEGYDALIGEVLRDNQAMLKLCRELGFTSTDTGQDGICNVHLSLSEEATVLQIDLDHSREPVMP